MTAGREGHTTMDMDVIDALVGVEPGSALDAIRGRRKQTREQAQASYRALFAPEDVGGITATERFAMAVFVTGLHGEAEIAAFYAARLAESGALAELRGAIDTALASAKGQGPYGSFPVGPLSRENTAGPTHRVASEIRHALGPRLAAAFEHLHMLLFHPRDAAPPALQSLLDAGWSPTDIVTLSQIAAYLSFQIRAVTGLRALAGAV
ncbi:MAG: CMD domain protein [Stellaceae bacterium]